MKDAEDEAFDELAKRQGHWGGGFQAKRAMAAGKLPEFCTCHETHPMECQGCETNRLARPAQEPVAWAVQGCSKMWRGEFAEIDAKAEAKRIGGTCNAYAFYTTPPQRPWVDLTDEEIDHQAKKDDHGAYFALGALWAGAKLKEKNNGT